MGNDVEETEYNMDEENDDYGDLILLRQKHIEYSEQCLRSLHKTYMV
jgi:hypothetical protein